nr:hypothetical protein [Tanacetum cinerariifolium]
GCIQTGGIIELIDADKDVSLDTAKIERDADVQRRQAESQEVVTVVAATITAATTPITATTITAAPSAARKRK